MNDILQVWGGPEHLQDLINSGRLDSLRTIYRVWIGCPNCKHFYRHACTMPTFNNVNPLLTDFYNSISEEMGETILCQDCNTYLVMDYKEELFYPIEKPKEKPHGR